MKRKYKGLLIHIFIRMFSYPLGVLLMVFGFNLMKFIYNRFSWEDIWTNLLFLGVSCLIIFLPLSHFFYDYRELLYENRNYKNDLEDILDN